MSKLTLPGLIDAHVHLRTPGQENKEDFYTGTVAAIAGGFTKIFDMPNNKIPITTVKRLEEKIKIAKNQIVCDLGFYFGSLGDNLEEFKFAGKKVFGLKLYLNETTGNFLINKEKLEQIIKAWAKASNKPILLHAEDDAVEYVIELVKKLNVKVHFCHISTSSDLKQIIKAKEENLPITCGITPHHLFLNKNDSQTLDSFGKMKPPLRSKNEVEFLWKNINAIDVIESDHAPHTIEEKKQTPPPFGVPGLETTLPLLLTAVSENKLTINDIIRLCHTNPAKIFAIKTDPETKIEVDLNSEFLIQNSKLHSKCGWSPFNGWKVKGKVRQVFIRGEKVFENDKIIVKSGFGKILS